jgi:hypothetical protein
LFSLQDSHVIVTDMQEKSSKYSSIFVTCKLLLGAFKVGLILLLIWSLIGIGWEMAISNY